VVIQTGEAEVPLDGGENKVDEVGVGATTGLLMVHGQSVMVKVSLAVAVYILVP